jgi:hypothetical protein
MTGGADGSGRTRGSDRNNPLKKRGALPEVSTGQTRYPHQGLSNSVEHCRALYWTGGGRLCGGAEVMLAVEEAELDATNVELATSVAS